MNQIFREKKGFTLVEIAIVLVIIGLLLGVGANMIGPLTKRIKLNETRETINADVESVTGYAVSNMKIPVDVTAFQGIVKNPRDAWTKRIYYFFDPLLTVTGSICGSKTTNLTICRDAACTDTTPNVAFIAISGGDNYNPQTGVITPAGCLAGQTCIGIYDADTANTDNCTTTTNCPDTNFPSTEDRINRATDRYDDVVKWVTLDELRTKTGCTGVTTTIPNPPAAVTATRATLSSLNLTWTPPTTNTDTSPIIDLVGYEIDRSLDGVTYSLLQSLGIGSSFTDTFLVAGQRYYYRMRAVDKDGNKSANSTPIASTTISPISQTVAAVWSGPANEAACTAAASAVPACATAANRRKALFTIRNTDSANIVIDSVVVEWGTTGGTVRKIMAPDASSYEYCNTTGVASGVTISPFGPFTINAGASSTIGIYWCTSGAQPTEVRKITFNTADGALSLY